MKGNMGLLDRGMRVGLAIFVALLFFNGFIEGILAFVFLAFAVVFLLTSAIGFCPLYILFGWNTGKEEI